MFEISQLDFILFGIYLLSTIDNYKILDNKSITILDGSWPSGPKATDFGVYVMVSSI